MIDDEEMILVVAQQILTRSGFEVVVARDGFEGLKIFRQRRAEIDLVLLDLSMPGMDGKETLREIRRSKAGVPVILTSGYSERVVGLPAAEIGPTEFLQKPYRVKTLLEKVQATLAG